MNQIESQRFYARSSRMRGSTSGKLRSKILPAPLEPGIYCRKSGTARWIAEFRQFINNSQYNKLSGSSISVSKIFEWYAGDFGDLIAHLNTWHIYSRLTQMPVSNTWNTIGI
ncbi:MAG: hypothetical protein R2792_06810 [Saprospiraceae bacterium]